MKIGIVCHAGFGGSGVIATELGLALAQRGHETHFFCPAPPVRFHAEPRVTFHAVPNPTHPLFPGGEYAIALASMLVDVCARERLDLLHLHYAIPHAVSAQLARKLLGRSAPKLVTTLHGTDVLTFGTDPAFAPVVRAAVAESDAVTTPSRFLRDEATRIFRVDAEVVFNFVSVPSPGGRGWSEGPGEGRSPALIHISNFRPVKRIEDVIRIFAKAREQIPCTLTMVGSGPDLSLAQRLITELNLEPHVTLMGDLGDTTELLQSSALFLLPSQTESFGLAALEALACGVPVIASRAGGLPEVISDNETGLLFPPGDVNAMAGGVVRLLSDRALHAKFSTEARRQAEARFRRDPLVDRYESIYRRVLAAEAQHR